MTSKDDKSLYGTIEGNSSGFGFFISENKDFNDVFISHENLNGALNKDKVKIKIIKESENGKNSEGKVVKILERNSEPIIGTFYKNKKFGFVVSDDKSDFCDIFIDKKNCKNAKNNDKVIVKINSYPKFKNPQGEIKNILGKTNDRFVDILSIVGRNKIPFEFSKSTKKEEVFIENKISNSEIEKRDDFRNLFTVTIDGFDSKDFDDAISLEKKDCFYELYVHIADVSYYVKEGSPIDKDAYKRGNSTYLYDLVIPMLPEKLSNGICSLNPNEDRLSVTLKMIINEEGNLVSQSFHNSVINSNYRLVYEDVNKFLDEGKDIYTDKVLCEKLFLFRDLYEKLEKKREKRGAIEFNSTESEIILNNIGDVKDIREKKVGVGNKIIEQFMLEANETVASFFSYLDIPFIYRIHDEPDKNKLEDFKNILSLFGYTIKGDNLYPKDFQKILKNVDGKDEEEVINSLMLRTMSKAKYSNERSSHFGLASQYYTHFTSPIRRYCDLIVHRIIKLFISNKISKIKYTSFNKKLEKQSLHLSETEKRSEKCEREVEDLEKCKFMKKYIGKKFDGKISSITNFGIFIRLQNTVEGLFMYKFSKDNFIFDENTLSVKNINKNMEYKIGQNVKIIVSSVNIEQRNIDFILE
ncbi:MAG: ribonuclease R [Peptoniphilaceae bacterium]|nr:ribonuclease R [Peptoniphilaceae bacterium]